MTLDLNMARLTTPEGEDVVQARKPDVLTTYPLLAVVGKPLGCGKAASSGTNRNTAAGISTK